MQPGGNREARTGEGRSMAWRRQRDRAALTTMQKQLAVQSSETKRFQTELNLLQNRMGLIPGIPRNAP
jgi:hypothetical protein